MISGVLLFAAVMLVSSVVYFATIGAIVRKVDTKIIDITQNFIEEANQRGVQSVANRIATSLVDGIDSDVEILLLLNKEDQRIAGNLARWNGSLDNSAGVVAHKVLSGRRLSESRVMTTRLGDGSFLVVGRDMTDIYVIRSLFIQSTFLGGGLAILLAIIAIFTLRHQIEKKIFSIRSIAHHIEAGNFSQRIAISPSPDEFDRLNLDINRMLDRIQHLMEGVTNVSNAIAHNIRTPLSLMRSRLDDALHPPLEESKLRLASERGIEEIDQLIVLLEKMLQIAEAESGARRSTLRRVNVNDCVQSLIELYDAFAEQKNIQITSHIPHNTFILGDSDLLVGALMNLFDNAVKYAGHGCHIDISTREEDDTVSIIFSDNGPGVPLAERDKVLQRFYRINHKGQGSGLGLAIVKAFTHIQDGQVYLEDNHPGLRVRLVFPRA